LSLVIVENPNAAQEHVEEKCKFLGTIDYMVGRKRKESISPETIG
jgi:hypothetical protein